MLLGPGGAIHAFADDPMRRLLRATSVYTHLLEPSCHPDHLRDAMDRERLFDLLWKVSQGQPKLLRVVAMEKADLRHGDVPYFSRPRRDGARDARGCRVRLRAQPVRRRGRNWPDLRETAGGTERVPRFMIAYCHGAPGIALSRLSALSLDPGSPARREVEIAVETTLAGCIQQGQTLCHGELGNLMIVHRAAALLGRDDWQRQVDHRLGVTLARLFERGPECSFDFPPSAPALMDGVAGIGYGLLYLTRPTEVPFVLDLSPLPARSGHGFTTQGSFGIRDRSGLEQSR